MQLGILSFFKDVFNFLKAGSVLGIDIGTVSIKIAEVSGKGENLKLENYAVLETKKYLDQSNQAIQSSSLAIVEKEAIKLLGIALREIKPKTKIAVASLPSFGTFITPLDMPVLSKEETSKSIAFQARQYIPLAADQVTVDWIKVDEADTKTGRIQRLIMIGIPNELIKKYKKIFRGVGLKLSALEVEGAAIARALRGDGATLVVDIGAESTNIVVGENGILKHSSQTDYGGVYLTQALSRSLGINTARAEELKRRRGLLATGGEAELSTLILPFLDVIIQEVKYAKDSYERRYSKNVEKMMIVGGGANMLGIEKYFGSQLNLRVVPPTTFDGVVYDAELEPAVKMLRNELVTPIGLAKRYFT